jgi:transketolase
MKPMPELESRVINTIRFLSADGVQQARSGHPGLPMGAAVMAYVIWTRHLRFNPQNPAWPDRDRFILSGGHGSMLLYSLLHLTGFDLSLEQLKSFRQWESLTPGHPEYGLTPGVEVTTGPLGQGFTNGVGMAIAEAHLAALFNQPGIPIIDHYIYAIVTDGDLMEGVSSEAASLAGHLRLGKLIYLYDDNRISIEGSTELAFTEDRGGRFEAYGWQVLRVPDGNQVEAVDAAIEAAKQDPRPSLIICPTTIGFGLPNKQGTAQAHGEPPGDEELNEAKKNMSWPIEPRFFIPDDVQQFFQKLRKEGVLHENAWRNRWEKYAREYPDLAAELDRRLCGRLPKDWESALPSFAIEPKGISTRAASGQVINALAGSIPELIGGSADLAPSNNTWIKGETAFQKETRAGRNFHFGVREHAMGSIVNGLSVHGGVIPYGGTFLVFSDYMRPAIRLSALSHYPSIWVFTHDSVGVGEDGPTHQPVEQVASLRTMPNLTVIRPADANEVSQAWRVAIQRRDGPTALIFTRQNLPVINRDEFASAEGLLRGAYVLADFGEGFPEIILAASGSEVSLIVEAGKILANEGVKIRLVSFPSWELFVMQDETYRNSVFPPAVKARLAVEAGVSMGWERWVGDSGKIISVDRYGASAPFKTIFDHYALTVESILQEARTLII